MDAYSQETYGDRIAEIYDEWYAEVDPAAIQRLAELAGGGKALELGIGTGRIAIPLVQSDIHVEGIDASEAMAAKLNAKPEGKNIAVTMGNFADVAVDGKYALIYVVFNTFYSLLSQDEQIRCFKNTASHLEAGGVFAIEAFVPDVARFTAGQTMRVIRIDDRQVRIDVSVHERDKQLITSQHVLLTEPGAHFYPVEIRYVWPSEMDLMARLAGMGLKERWGDWSKGAFTAESGKHISVYELES